MRSSRHVLSTGVLIGAVLLAVSSSFVSATPGIVKTKAGAIYSGDVVERGNVVIVNIRGVETRLSKGDVESIEYQTGSISEQIAERRTKLANDDVKGRVELARFAMDHHELDLAMELAIEAVNIDPRNDEAISVRETIRRQRHADHEREKNAPAIGTSVLAAPPATTTAPTTSPTAPTERKFLSPEDIQQIRRSELKPGDNARVQIPQDVKRKYTAQQGIAFTEFNSMTPIEQALAIFNNGDDSMKSQVKIVTDPESLVEFKRQVQPMVLTGCATSSCHGGSNGGNFTLHSAENDAATYTNFYILSQYSKNIGEGNNQGIFGGMTERKLIERGHGETSLLAQYALAPSKATHKHPRITKGSAYNGMFKDPEDQRFKRLVNWMNNSLNQIEPDYQINYPVPRATRSAPATNTPAPPAATPPAATRPTGARPNR